jgi:6-phosphogluconolactonase
VTAPLTGSGRIDDLQFLPDGAALADRAAALVVDAARDAIERRGVFDLCLSGGSTPRAMYRRLVAGTDRHGVDWSRARFFFGDERCVPPEHADSNYGLARRELLDPLGIHEGAVHRMRGELEPVEAAERYEAVLESGLGPGFPRFDLVLLGLGSDGHTASLFPGTSALRDSRRRCVANLVGGTGKADAVRALLADDGDADRCPARLVRPTDGALVVLADAGSVVEDGGDPGSATHAGPA